jgi:hypothetical protein
MIYDIYDILGIIGGDLANSQKASISRMLISISIYLFDAIPLYKYVYSYDNYCIDIHYFGQMSIFNRNKWPQAPLDAGSFWGSPRPVSTLDRWLLSQAAWYTSIVVSCCICCIYIYHVDGIMMVIWCYIHIYSLLFTRVAYMTTHLGVRWTKNDLICKLIAACVGRVDLPWHRSKSNRNLKFVLSYP